MNYLSKPHRQSLLDRQPEVDAAIVSYLERRIATVDEVEPRFALGGFLKLARLRTAVFGHRLRTPVEPDFRLFRDILADASATSRQWGGTMTLVYLPSYNRFLRGREEDHPMLAEMHRHVLEIATAQHISTIDIEKAFF